MVADDTSGRGIITVWMHDSPQTVRSFSHPVEQVCQFKWIYSLLRLFVGYVTVKLRLPTSSMIKQTMHLSGSNRSNCQVQAALNAVTDITKESVWFIIIYCFFTVDTVKVLQYRLWYLLEELAEFGFVREECEKNFENHWARRLFGKSWFLSHCTIDPPLSQVLAIL